MAFQTTFQLRGLSQLSLRHFGPRVRNPKTPKSVVAPPHIPPPENVAIVGTGLCGLATAYHLRSSTARYHRKRGTQPPTITLISPRPLSGASPAAAGLLHPFTPRVKKFVWKGRRGFAAAEHLLDAVSSHADTSFYRQSGMLRLALSDKQKSDFIAAANRHPSDVEYLDPPETAHRFPQVAPLPAAFLPKAYVVDTPAYMKALWKTCEQLGVRYIPDTVKSVRDILGRRQDRFDTVIVCAGAEVLGISDLSHVPITPCRGQNVFLKTSLLPDVPVISGKYLVPDYFGHGVMAGATFEYPDESIQSYLTQGNKTDTKRAIDEVTESVERLIPGLFSNSEVLGACAGLRALPPRSEEGSIPIACRVKGLNDDVSVWLSTGLGSRGLLHHAYLGRVMAHAVIAGNENLLPTDARRCDVSLGGQETDGAEGDRVLTMELTSQ